MSWWLPEQGPDSWPAGEAHTVAFAFDTVPGASMWMAAAGVAVGACALWGERVYRRMRHGRESKPEVEPGRWIVRDPRDSGIVSAALAAMRPHAAALVRTMVIESDVVSVYFTAVLEQPPGRDWRPRQDSAGWAWMADLPELPRWARLPPARSTLVTVGRSTAGPVLLDLASAGAIGSIEGDPADACKLLESVVFELTTNPWTKDVRPVLVGFSGRAGVPRPGAVRYAAGLGDLWADLETLATRGQRVVLMLASVPTAGETHRLAELVAANAGMLSVVYLGWTDSAQWTLEAWQGGVRLRPLEWQLGSIEKEIAEARDRCGALVSSSRLAIAGESSQDDEELHAAPGESFDEQTVVKPAMAEIRLLGPVSVTVQGTATETTDPVLAQIVLGARNPEGLPDPVLGELLRAPGAPQATIQDGHLRIAVGAAMVEMVAGSSGNWFPAGEIRLDVDVFGHLVGGAYGEGELRALVDALALIRGELPTGAVLGPHARTTLRTLTAHMGSEVVRVVRRTAEVAASSGDLDTVEWAIRQGLTLLPRVEGLWRTLVMFCREYHRPGLGELAEHMYTTLLEGDHGSQLNPHTVRMVQEIRREYALSSD
ncbi:bacterial transcriptional activator domain-containing protein [Saccharomonospora sp. NPDC006951]